jgi:hypothetical protein
MIVRMRGKRGVGWGDVGKCVVKYTTSESRKEKESRMDNELAKVYLWQMFYSCPFSGEVALHIVYS